jgi:transcription antitermination factor NusG
MKEIAAAWHLIYTRPQQERKVARLLHDRGTEYYLPVIKSVRQWHDRKKTIEQPLFPSYLFVKVNNIEDYTGILNLEAVCCFIKQEKKTVVVDQGLLVNIKKMLTSEGSIVVSSDSFKPGQNYLIQTGVFKGMNCEVINIQGHEKIIVRIDILSRNLLIALDSYCLKLAS